MGALLVTGASGNVGRVVVRILREAGADVRPAARTAAAGDVAFDFTDPGTWSPAYAGVEAMFVVRPPALGNVRRDLLPALRAARAAGVRHMVLLSLQGAERNPVVPHAALEKWLRDSGLSWTFVRPSFFAQNLSTTHAADIRERDTIFVPAGRGATAFVDVEDVGAVAAAALIDPAAHAYRAWTVTGPRALSYDHVADILTAELGRRICYPAPGALCSARHARGSSACPGAWLPSPPPSTRPLGWVWLPVSPMTSGPCWNAIRSTWSTSFTTTRCVDTLTRHARTNV